MPGMTCLRFKGLRLDGQYVGLFDSDPQNYTVTSIHHGVADVCRKLKYPPAHDVKMLVNEGELLASIPLDLIQGRYWFKRPPPPYHWHLTKEAALAAMWASPVYQEDEPFVNEFCIYFLAQVYNNPLFGWTSKLDITRQGMHKLTAGFDPLWFSDLSINFHLCFTAPFAAGAPSFVRFSFLDKSIAYNSGPYSTVLDKALLSVPDFQLFGITTTEVYDYDRFLQIPEIPFSNWRGWQITQSHLLNFRLEVRRSAEWYRVCWPSEVLDRANCAAIIDRGSGLVIGPPIYMD
jgi:hypothetical protein